MFMWNWIKKKKIWGGAIFIIGVIIGNIVDRIIDWSSGVISDIPISVSDIILIIGLIVGGTLIAIGIYELRKDRKPKIQEIHNQFNPKYSHLTVHYSSRTDMPNKPNPSRPRYIVNNKTKEAYWTSTPIDKLLDKGEIQWHTHDNVESLKKYLSENNIHINERDPIFGELSIQQE